MSRAERDERRHAAKVVDDAILATISADYPGLHLPPIAYVIAAYKEKDNIGRVLEGLPKTLAGLDTRAIVVVDGNDDGTGEVARAAGAVTAIAPVNRGQGAALKVGYQIARTFGAKFIVTADADGQANVEAFEGIAAPLVAGELDFVNGSRILGATEVKSAARNSGIFIFAHLISLATRTRVTDTANPIRAFSTELSEKIQLDEPQFQASELLISAIMSGARFGERPMTMKRRTSGKSKKGGNFSYGRSYARVVFQTLRRERRKNKLTR